MEAVSVCFIEVVYMFSVSCGISSLNGLQPVTSLTRQLCIMFLLPFPLSAKDTDIIDEAIYYFKANVFFKNYEIKVRRDLKKKKQNKFRKWERTGKKNACMPQRACVLVSAASGSTFLFHLHLFPEYWICSYFCFLLWFFLGLILICIMLFIRTRQTERWSMSLCTSLNASRSCRR